MKLNNLQKNFYIFFSVVISILIATLLWEKISLPLNNTTGAKGLLVSKGYNPDNDIIRYILFITLPLIVYLFLNQTLKKKTIKVRELIFEKDKNFNETFVQLAREVYFNNDRRAKIKLEINKIFKSNITEIKKYANY